MRKRDGWHLGFILLLITIYLGLGSGCSQKEEPIDIPYKTYPDPERDIRARNKVRKLMLFSSDLFQNSMPDSLTITDLKNAIIQNVRNRIPADSLQGYIAFIDEYYPDSIALENQPIVREEFDTNGQLITRENPFPFERFEFQYDSLGYVTVRKIKSDYRMTDSIIYQVTNDPSLVLKINYRQIDKPFIDTLQFDPMGYLLKEGNTSYTYDEYGRLLTKITRYQGGIINKTLYSYDRQRLLFKVIETRDSKSLFYYNGSGLLDSVSLNGMINYPYYFYYQD